MSALSHRVFLSFGANLGDRFGQIREALASLQRLPQFQLEAQSSYYETAPQDVVDQPWFLNLVARGQTTWPPEQLLKSLQTIEQSLGRERGPFEQKRGPRLIDIDILLFDDLILRTAALTLPHPRMHTRRFVLEPLREIYPEGVHPESGRSFASLLEDVRTQELGRVDQT